MNTIVHIHNSVNTIIIVRVSVFRAYTGHKTRVKYETIVLLRAGREKVQKYLVEISETVSSSSSDSKVKNRVSLNRANYFVVKFSRWSRQLLSIQLEIALFSPGAPAEIFQSGSVIITRNNRLEFSFNY